MEQFEMNIESSWVLLEKILGGQIRHSDYHLIHRELNCDEVHMFVSDETHIQPLHVESNGSLIIKLNNEIIRLKNHQ